MRTRSFGTIIVGDICVHPGYRMGQEYRHVETQNIEFGNSSAENSLNIPWNITNEGLFQAVEPVIKAVPERFVRQNSLNHDGQIVYIDNLAYELSFLPAVTVKGTGRDIRPQLKPVSKEIGPELCGKDLMIWTRDLVPVIGHLVEISEYDLLLRKVRSWFRTQPLCIPWAGGGGLELDGLLSLQALEQHKTMPPR